jgi:hypothetical protein
MRIYTHACTYRCVPCPRGTYSDVTAKYHPVKPKMVAETVSEAAGLCTVCEEWQVCDGGNA